MELKACPKVKVGIRATNKKNDGAEWLEVGHVKFQSDVGAPVAVARQRALIAEVRAGRYRRRSTTSTTLHPP
jgi:hypothetical protein